MENNDALDKQRRQLSFRFSEFKKYLEILCRVTTL
jgi:hypothetical protein